MTPRRTARPRASLGDPLQKITVEVIQFYAPNGRQSIESTQLPRYLKSQYELMQSCGCRFTAEVLTLHHDGMVSVCIEEPGLGDFDIRVIPNGPKVQEAMAEMLDNFNRTNFEQFKSQVS